MNHYLRRKTIIPCIDEKRGMTNTMDKEIAHKRLLHILCVFDELCSSNQVRYSLHGGTLLGAVRGNGFIPWDDDADVALSRADYLRLVAAVEKLPEYHIRGNIKKQFCKIDDPEIWVDLFVCDYITDNKFLQKVKLGLLTVLDIMRRDRKSMKLSNLEGYSRAKQLIYKVIYVVGKLFPRVWLTKLYLHISEKWFLGDRKTVFRSSDHYVGRKKIFPAKWLERSVRVSFMGKELPVLEEYDLLLKQCFGGDYMTPMVDDRSEKVHGFIRSEKRIEL